MVLKQKYAFCVCDSITLGAHVVIHSFLLNGGTETSVSVLFSVYLGLLHLFHKSSHHIHPLSVCMRLLFFFNFFLSLLGLCDKHKLEDLISYPAPAMPKKSCPEGQAWDNLLRICHGRQIEPSRKPHPPTGEFHSVYMFREKGSWTSSKTKLAHQSLASVWESVWKYLSFLVFACFYVVVVVFFTQFYFYLFHGSEWAVPVNIFFMFLKSSELILVTVNQLRAKTATTDTLLVQSPVLWVCVIVATLGSILALTLWFVRFRRQTVSGNSGKDLFWSFMLFFSALNPEKKNVHIKLLEISYQE